MTKTKNERITALEDTVAMQSEEISKLKLIVHELRGKKSVELSTTNTVEDIIELEGDKYRKVDREAKHGDVIMYSEVGEDWSCITPNKPYKVYQAEGPIRLLFTRDSGRTCRVYGDDLTLNGLKSKNINVYELIKSKPLTPNQQRAAIIEKAKKFVEKYNAVRAGNKTRKNEGNTTATQHYYETDFFVKEQKVTAVVYWLLYGEIRIKESREVGRAECNPTDVFNEHIGKAIALGRALGLDVSEFEQAVQPTKVLAGMQVQFYDHDGKDIGIAEVESVVEANYCHCGKWGSTHFEPNKTNDRITNDTNAKY
ncbi:MULTISPECIES: hypothetical protein [unclassified Lysinibacillus]|uniref:hypothetical protein n=1 Tax=unclassified Lysinibacillus TaxID=2636778 RepID=UPI00380ACCEC